MQTTNRWIFLGVVVIGLAYSAAPLHAQPANEAIEIGGEDRPWNQGVAVEVRDAARALFLKGNEQFQIPLFAQAAEHYAAALARWKHPAFYFNLALAQLNLGQVVEAHDNLEQALRYGEQPLGAKRFQVAQKQFEEVQRQLGQIRVTCATEAAEVTLDGVALFTGPGSHQAWVKAKAHEVTAKRPDYLSEARRVTVSPGEIKSLDLRLITLGEAAEAGRRWAIWKPWAVIAAGGAVAAAGGVLNVLSSRNFNDFDARFAGLTCAAMPPHGCAKTEIPRDLTSLLNRARREQELAVAGYIVGGSLIATGVVLLYMNRPRLLEQSDTSSPVGRVAVVPTVSADALGVLVTVHH
jgi:tetratricopeptide (TPR) repeat protein